MSFVGKEICKQHPEECKKFGDLYFRTHYDRPLDSSDSAKMMRPNQIAKILQHSGEDCPLL